MIDDTRTPNPYLTDPFSFLNTKPKRRRRMGRFHGLKDNETLRVWRDWEGIIFELTTERKSGKYRVRGRIGTHRIKGYPKFIEMAIVDLLTHLRYKSMMKTIKSDQKKIKSMPQLP